MGRLKCKGDGEVSSTFTSMIDIVFLLLIFFILQPFKETELRLGAELPQQPVINETPQPPELSVNVRLLPVLSDPGNAQYVVDGHVLGMADRVDSRRLGAWLMKQSGRDTTVPVRIAPDSNVRFDHVARVLDACYSVHMSKVQFADR